MPEAAEPTNPKERSFGKNREGAAAVEFALVMIPFFASILFCLQMAIVYLAAQGLETFNQDTSRGILTGATQAQNLTQAQFKTQLCSKLPSMYNCSHLMVDVQVASSFSSATVATPTLTFDASGQVTNTWVYNPGNPGDIVVVRMMYLWPVVTDLGTGINNAGSNNRLLESTAVFKNEQYL